MEKPIASVEIVSDGIVVRFSDGVATYFPQGFLREHIGRGSNQVFVEYDQSFDFGLAIPSTLRLQ